jgi:hypothetical protein
MIIFNFKIDKKACFVYFIQSLVDWGWYFDKNNQEYFLDIVGDLNKKEVEALKKMKNIFNRENNYFLWLWRRYNNLSFRNKNEKEDWNKIKQIFEKKFNKIWDHEINKLEYWKERLNSFSFYKFEEGINKVSNFFDYDNYPKKIDVKLMFYWNKENITAHVRKDFNDLIILNLSNLESSELSKKRIINVLLHEFIHKIQYESDIFYKNIKISLNKIIKPYNLSFKKEVKWKYLLEETIASAIASRRFNNYFGRKLADKSEVEDDIIKFFNLDNNRENFGYLIRYVASKMENEVLYYLENNKKFDLKLSNFVAKKWVDLLS